MDCFSFVDFAIAGGQLSDYYVCRFIARAEHSSLREHLYFKWIYFKIGGKKKMLKKCETISIGAKTRKIKSTPLSFNLLELY